MYYYFMHPIETLIILIGIPFLIGLLIYLKKDISIKRVMIIAILIAILLCIAIPFTLGAGYWAQ